MASQQLGDGCTVADLSHRALVEIFERLGRIALDQSLDRFADMVSAFESGRASQDRPAMGAILPVKQHGERLLSGIGSEAPR